MNVVEKIDLKSTLNPWMLELGHQQEKKKKAHKLMRSFETLPVMDDLQ